MLYKNSKRRNYFVVDTKSLHIICATYNTRSGFAHECSIYSSDGKRWEFHINYYNRTWESFDYESLLQRAASKISVAYAEEIREYIRNRNDEERKRAESMFESFKRLHDKLTDEQKESLKSVTIHDESEARAVMGVMACMGLTNK